MATSGTAWSFFGRRGELAALEAALDDAAAGRGALVLVSGEAGIGKSRLCEELVALARARDVDVSWAACWESGTVPAYWPWEQIVLRLGGHHLVPAAAAPSPPADPDLARAERFERVVSLLAGASATQPRLLLLDDLHWADVGSVRLLSHVAVRLRDLPVLAVGTFRDDEVPPGTPLGVALADLARHGRRVVLAGLEAADMAPLVASVTGTGTTESTALALHRHTSGNPLFARELVRLLHATGTLDLLGADATGHLPVPDTVRGVLDGRLGRLRPGCRRVLEIGAVVGDEFPLDVVTAVLAAGERDAVLDDVGEAVAALVVREAAVGRWTFAHPLVRSVLYEELGVARRVRLHQRVGEVLEDRHAAGHTVDLAALSHHFVRAAAAGTAAKAVGYARQAAARAMAMLAYEDAVALGRQALAALDLAPSAADRADVLLDLGVALTAAGDLPGARAACLDAAALARAAGQPDRLARAALGVGGGGFEVAPADRGAVDLLEEARRALGPEPSGLRAQVGARLSVALWQLGDEDRRRALAEEALADAPAGGPGVTPAVRAAALAAHCDVIAGPAGAERRLEEAGEVVDLGVGAGDRAIELLGRRLRLVARLETGDVAGADADLEAYAAVVALLGQPLYGWYVPLWRGMRALMRGDLAAADRWRREAAETGARASSANAEILAGGLHWFCLREAARFDEGLALLGDVLPLEASWGVQIRVAASLMTAEAGRTGEARALLDAAAPALPATPVDAETVAMLGQAAEAAWLVGGHPLAGWAYDALLPARHRCGVEGIGAVCWGSVERPLGFLAACLGRPADAAGHFDAALRANRALGAPLLVARTHRDAGVVLDDPARLATALAAYRDLGLDRRVAELEERLAGREAPSAVEAAPAANVFRLDGHVWTLGFAGTTAHVKDVKGLHDLARLLAHPGEAVAAADLAGRGAAGSGHLGDVVDARARDAYRARLVELAAELHDADARGDAARSARAEEERDALLGQLSAAFGLAGRPRKAGDAAERARVAVTWRIRDAVKRVDAVHPALGRHLRRSVRTGTFCAYDPDEATPWSV